MTSTPGNPRTGPLASPTQAGQTHALARLDGRLVALAYWDRLPYWLRAAWQPALGDTTELRMRAWLEAEASPMALAAAASSSALPGGLQELARRRYAALPETPPTAPIERLAHHFDKLIALPKNALLRHLGSAERVDPQLDRLDMLAEVVALRHAQADVRTERALTRAFRAMFATREPFAVWCLISLCFAVFLGLAFAGREAADAAYAGLRLEPGLERPWTLVTYAFLHLDGDVRHVLLNMLALAGVGPVLELVLGSWRFVAFFVAGAAFGGLISVVAKVAFSIPFATVGASAAIASCAGLAIALGVWFQRRHGRIPMRYTAGTFGGGLVLVSNFLVSAASGGSGVDHAAHLGGLAFGVATAVVLTPTLAARAQARYASRAPPAG